MKVIVVGGGAAGFFTAINIASKNKEASVTILEKSSKVLSKVKVSGGGRCNVTNNRSKPSEIAPFYPRGGKKLYSVFQKFGTSDMVAWLLDRGVQTKAEEDQRVFPTSNSSQSIIDCFQNECRKLNIEVKLNESVEALSQDSGGWQLTTNQSTHFANKVIFCTGSSEKSMAVLENIGLKLAPRSPSLFTFNISDIRLADLPGVAFEGVKIRIVKTKLEESGPMLITHWGLSGPAILKLSAWGAPLLQSLDYNFEILINFTGNSSFGDTQKTISNQRTEHPSRKSVNYPLFGIPRRFWERICEICEIGTEQVNGELSNKQINKLCEEISQGRYQVSGKSTFKDEFVTCGGVDLSEIDINTFECKRFPNLYIAGELLDIDALTGGFNFQACWSAGWLISENLK